MKSEMLWNLLRVCLPGVALLLAFNASAQSIIQIASDYGTAYFVKSDGSLWQGDNTRKMAKMSELMNRANREEKDHLPSSQTQAQLNEMVRHMTPAYFEPDDLIVSNGVTAVAMRSEDFFFIKDNGSLWAMGNNQGGFLGNGAFDTPDHPIEIVSNGVVAVACGETFTIFLKDDGSLWGFGWSGNGALATSGENEVLYRPTMILNSNVVAIAAGYSHSLFLKHDGSLWGMGNNGFGQLGVGTNMENAPLPVEIVASNVTAIAAAHYQSLFIKHDGSLWAMGLNQSGQLGDCTIDWRHYPEQIVSSNVVAVTAGDSGSLFLKNDGSLWGMGINWGTDYGEGIEFDSKCPTQVFAANNSAMVAGYYYSVQLKACVSVWAGKFNNSTGATTAHNKLSLRSGVVSLPGYNLITVEPLKNGDVRLTYSGSAGANYALERSSSLANPNWIPLVTNKTPIGGVLVITNTPNATINNFWRIRSVR